MAIIPGSTAASTPKRRGRQTPTASVILPYDKSLGHEAVELYNKSGRKAQEWQELLITDILAYNDEGLWVHSKYGYSLPRRNGKNEVVVMRELYGIVNGEKIMHTAHRTTTSHSAWERLQMMLTKCGFEEGKHFKTLKQMGLEEIRMSDAMGGGRANFRTRSSKTALGEEADLLIIDEAQEYTDDQATALKYIVSSSQNAQTLYCGTPPTAVSAGTVFMHLRKSCLQGRTKNMGWAEWSVDFLSDCEDINLWYETNPSLGTIISERRIWDELGDSEDETDFNIQRLGLWLSYSQKSAISRNEWQSLEAKRMPKLEPRIFAGVKFGVDCLNATLSIAVRTDTKDPKVFVEVIDCQPIRNGNDWIVAWLMKLQPEMVLIDGQSGSQQLIKALKDARFKGKAEQIGTQAYIEANSTFENAVFSGSIVHKGQPSLEDAVSNCEHRAIGTKGGFGYKPTKAGLEVGLIDSVVLAHFAAATAKDKTARKPRVY